ncbi:methyltransferase domain-containing protein [Flavitalea antarctica]
MQPFYDCMQLIEPRSSMTIIDLGCGTGELTVKLAEHFSGAETIVGIDSSREMLQESTRFEHSKLSFRQTSIEDQLETETCWDLKFSNAAIQWIGEHHKLIPSIISRLKPGGQLAIQLPSQHHNVTNTLLRELAATTPYRDELKDWTGGSPVLDSSEYAEILFRQGGQQIQVFEKIYPVIVEDTDALFDWVSGTALIPYLERLRDDITPAFIAEYKGKLRQQFRQGPVFYPFKRIIMYASF